MGQSSDHIPSSTCLRLTREPVLVTKRRAFKLLHMDKVRKLEQTALLPPRLSNREDTYDHIEKIQTYLHTTMEAAIPWAKPSAESNPIRNKKCEETKSQVHPNRGLSESRDKASWKADKKHGEISQMGWYKKPDT